MEERAGERRFFFAGEFKDGSFIFLVGRERDF
jgi:hypothetical protein